MRPKRERRYFGGVAFQSLIGQVHLSQEAFNVIVLAALLPSAFIAFRNARAAGLGWIDSKIVGGYPRLMMWCGLALSAIGFSEVILSVITLILQDLHHIPPDAEHFIYGLWYVVVAIPLFGLGVLKLVNSWVRFSREKDTWSAMVALGSSQRIFWQINSIASIFSPPRVNDSQPWSINGGDAPHSSDAPSQPDKSSTFIVLAIVIVGVAMLGGALITALIAISYMDPDKSAVRRFQKGTHKQIREAAMEQTGRIY